MAGACWFQPSESQLPKDPASREQVEMCILHLPLSSVHIHIHTDVHVPYMHIHKHTSNSKVYMLGLEKKGRPMSKQGGVAP